MSYIITIGREFGSGGREIGLRVAEALHIPFYDKEIITLIAEKGELAHDVLEKYEESVMHTGFLSPRPALFTSYTQPLSDKIFMQQYKAIQELAEQGACVIVGRCADYVLNGKSINVFVHADMPARIQRKRVLNIDVPEKDMEKHIRNVDKKRRNYYYHYTDRTWGMSQNYDLCIDTTKIGIKGGVEMILHYLKCCVEV